MKSLWKRKKKSKKNSSRENFPPENAIIFHYSFRFEDGSEKDIKIHLDPETLRYLPETPPTGDEWTRLEHHRCENCPGSAESDPHCHVALCIEDLVRGFSEKLSYETAEVTVRTHERTYSKETTLQKGLSSVIGILMVSSGCPVMARLRPMVRFHLPFSTVLETTFRTTSTYLLGQFFLQERGKGGDFALRGLVDIYKSVNMVNKAMARRINSLAAQDASVNALTILDIFAIDIPDCIEENIEDLESFFGLN